ncbi:MAG TPA: hypothetical protein VGG99_08665 [Acetobacteraceae bacterium]
MATRNDTGRASDRLQIAHMDASRSVRFADAIGPSEILKDIPAASGIFALSTLMIVTKCTDCARRPPAYDFSSG